MNTAQELQKIQSHLKTDFSLFGLDHVASTFLVLLFSILVLGVLCVLSYYLTRFFLLRFLRPFMERPSFHWLDIAYQHRVFHRVCYLTPVLVAYLGAPLIDFSGFIYGKDLTNLVRLVAIILMIAVGAFAIYAVLDSFAEQYRHYKFARQRPIKSYLQVIKIVLFILAGLLIISNILSKSPMYFLTGLGAMTAILMLVFKDSILGFVASIQLAAYDMVHIGDWIEVPAFGANGDVIDISLNTIKIRNFDNTIVMIPAHALLTNAIKNWRGMSESGGRRIKRAVYLDATTVRFCGLDFLEMLKNNSHFEAFWQERLQAIHHQYLQKNADISSKALTNLSLLRYYLEAYLAQYPDIHQGMTLMVRQLPDEGEGIPLEIYAFTKGTHWGRYEQIQADIFDHIYAIVPCFELRIFQHLSGKQIEVKMPPEGK